MRKPHRSKLDNAFIEGIKEEIDLAISYVKRLGYKIRPGMWVGTRDKCCCPLGACLIENSGVDQYVKHIEMEPWKVLPTMLSISPEEMYSFADGFDARPLNDNHSPTFYRLGKLYRDKYERNLI